MEQRRFDSLLDLFERLEKAKINYEMISRRQDGVTILVRGPQNYWEISSLKDGTIAVERFVSSGQIEDESSLEELFARFAVPEPVANHERART
jgi:hypothetical protein